MTKAIHTESVQGPVALNNWCSRTGVSPITAWRWRKKGWLKTINIAGRQYLTQEGAAEFTERAQRGERHCAGRLLRLRHGTGGRAKLEAPMDWH
jgi:hypothetical protein